MDPTAGGPQQQAVWSQFPSTDPTVLGQIMAPALQGGGPDSLGQAFSALLPLMQQDQDTLAQMQRQQVQALIEQLMGPAGPPQGGPQPGASGPQTGGETMGY